MASDTAGAPGEVSAAWPLQAHLQEEVLHITSTLRHHQADTHTGR